MSSIFRALAFTSAFLITLHASAQSSYRVTNLGNLGYPVSSALAINDSGDVAGIARIKLTSGAGLDRAFLWTKTGGMKNIGTLQGGGADRSQAYGLSSNDIVAGVSTINDGREWQAVEWSASGGMVAEGSGSNYGLSVNASGEVVGFYFNLYGLTEAWSSTVALSDSKYAYTQALSVNDAGFVVGTGSGRTTGLRESLLWTPTNELFVIGILPGGLRSEAHSISSNNFVAGWSQDATLAQHPYLWTRAGGMQDLGLLSGSTGCVATGVNSSGVVVGQCNYSSGGPHAFVWSSALGIQDLNSLVTNNSWGTITTAAGINSSGQIAATTGYGSPMYAVLLNPVAQR